jgi:hypothetical protein
VQITQINADSLDAETAESFKEERGFY